MTFPQFLEMKFLEWQRQQGGRKTVKEFANWIGVSQQTISSWWNNANKVPEGENLIKLAVKLGLEVYDVLGKPRPDEHLYAILSGWDEYTPEQRRALSEQGEEYKAQNQKKKENAPKRRPQTAH